MDDLLCRSCFEQQKLIYGVPAVVYHQRSPAGRVPGALGAKISLEMICDATDQVYQSMFKKYLISACYAGNPVGKPKDPRQQSTKVLKISQLYFELS